MVLRYWRQKRDQDHGDQPLNEALACAQRAAARLGQGGFIQFWCVPYVAPECGGVISRPEFDTHGYGLSPK